MAYIGAEPVPGQNREVDDISSGFNGNATAFTLQVSSVNVSPESANNILINLGGVLQNPGTDYTIAASTITFTTAPAAGLSFFGLILGAGINTATVADQTIGTSKVLDNAITADKLAHTSVTAGSYTTADITVDAQGRITAAASGSISNAEIANNAVTTAKIADSTGASDGVTTAKLATDAVTAAKLASNSVVSDSIVDGSIVNADVNASAAIAGTKISPDFGSQNIVTTGSISGAAGTLTGDLTIPDTIVHTGDTNTKIRFPAADTVTAETGGVERLRINSTGQTIVGDSVAQLSTSSERPFQVHSVNGPKIAIGRNDTSISAGNTIGGLEFYGNDANGTFVNTATIEVNADGTHGDNDKPTRMQFSTTADNASSATERLRIDSNGFCSQPFKYQLVVSRSGNQSGYDANGSFGTALIFNNIVSEHKDSALSSCFNTSNGLFTVPVEGIYFLEASAYRCFR